MNEKQTSVEIVPCSSCHDLAETSAMAVCPACGRLTCSSCQCPDEDGQFVICQSCADLAAVIGGW